MQGVAPSTAPWADGLSIYTQVVAAGAALALLAALVARLRSSLSAGASHGPLLAPDFQCACAYCCGEYKVGRRLGEGAFATTFLANRRQDGSRLVLKCAYLGSLEDARDALDEAEYLRAFGQHPNVVRYEAVFLHQGAPPGAGGGHGKGTGFAVMLAMEHCTRGDMLRLLRALRRQCVTLMEQEVLRSWAHLACALRHCHAHGVLHRDLKPENVLLTRAGTLKLADFGLARRVVAAAADPRYRANMSVVGTPLYMAPEVEADTPYGPPSDVWGLACLMLELATGRAIQEPPRGVSRIDAILHRVSAVPDHYESQAAMQRLLRAMLDRDQGRRPTLDRICASPLLTPYLPRSAVDSGGGGAAGGSQARGLGRSQTR